MFGAEPTHASPFLIENTNTKQYTYFLFSEIRTNIFNSGGHFVKKGRLVRRGVTFVKS